VGEAATTAPVDAVGGAIADLSRMLGLAPKIEASPRGVLDPLPRPALRWVGPAGRIAVREFHFDSDADTICAFQQDTYSLNFPDFHFTRSFAQAFRHDLLRAALDSQHGLFVLDGRAPEHGGIAGFLWVVVCENSWTSERYGYVNNVYVSPTLRGQSLGVELMRQADDFFRSRGVRRVRLTVTAANEAAASLYHRSGYRVTRWEMEKEL
jgi:ribosomal protein S18 acetylase RimI-like enzyme